MKVKYRYAYRAHRHCEQPHHVTFGTISIPSLFFGPPPLCVPICPFRRHGWHGSGGGRKRGRGRSGGPTKIRLSERPIACRSRGKRETNNGPSRLCVCVCVCVPGSRSRSILTCSYLKIGCILRFLKERGKRNSYFPHLSSAGPIRVIEIPRRIYATSQSLS